MPDREKVILGLECCSDRRKDGIDKCVECPYNDWMITCAGDVLIDALELLKAQEPRVMTLEEWENAPEPADGECLCYEIKNTGLRAVIVKVFKGYKELYGKWFRCWTSRPTDEQREAVKWND